MSKTGSDNLPLYMRLAQQTEHDEKDDSNDEMEQERSYSNKKRKSMEEESNTKKIGRSNKNAPAEMPSNKPVRRLRIDANNTVKKTIDPRFSDFSGTINDKIFNTNYAFLDEYREDEIKKLSTVLKKVKSEPKKQALKEELIQMKQKHSERKRGLRVMERMEALKREEKEKIKQGKKPFFMKASAVKAVELEERFNELKREGKLNKFMNKKRKKNASKDHRWLPSRRGDDE